MKAISIRQPWAWLILHAGKDIENRTWATTYRGPILIHAAKGMTMQEFEDAMNFVYCIRNDYVLPKFEKPKISDLERGGIVGQAELAACVLVSSSPWKGFGSWGFVLRNVKPLPFRPLKGQLGIFDVSPLP